MNAAQLKRVIEALEQKTVDHNCTRAEERAAQRKITELRAKYGDMLNADPGPVGTQTARGHNGSFGVGDLGDWFDQIFKAEASANADAFQRIMEMFGAKEEAQSRRTNTNDEHIGWSEVRW